MARSRRSPTGTDGPILVLIQLAGGNDGLNAVVPYTNDFYYQARPTIAIPADQVLTLNDTLGLNPAMTGFKSLFDAGHLSVVNGVGYPNPNRSHFRSTEIWQTASDEDKYLTDGWLGRYFDNACQGCDPTVGINIGPRLPQAFASHTPTGISLENPDSYRFIGAGKNDDETLAYRSMYAPAGRSTRVRRRRTPAPASAWSPARSCCKTARARSIFWSARRWTRRSARTKFATSPARRRAPRSIPAAPSRGNLQLVARLIAGGLPTRVFYVSQGGYDTHTGQRDGAGRPAAGAVRRGEGFHRRPHGHAASSTA